METDAELVATFHAERARYEAARDESSAIRSDAVRKLLTRYTVTETAEMLGVSRARVVQLATARKAS